MATRPVCRFWLQGRCKFGSDCRNAHPPRRRKPTSTGAKQSNRRPRKQQQQQQGGTTKTPSVSTTLSPNVFVLVRSFLTIPDLNQCSKALPSLRPSCKTFGVRQLLSQKTAALAKRRITLRKTDKVFLERMIIQQQASHCNTIATGESHRFLFRRCGTTGDLLFHPMAFGHAKRLVLDYLDKRQEILKDFFAKEAGGTSIFTRFVAPFLTVHDMVAAAGTGPTLHRLCRLYTVPELLSKKPLLLTRQLRISIGIQVMQNVVSHGGHARGRPARIVTLGREECFRAKLYHPAELIRVHYLLDKYLDKFGTPKPIPSPLGFFSSIFPNGEGGTLLFSQNIAPFLTTTDVDACSRTGRALQSICQLYTIHNMLQKKCIVLPLEHVKHLGNLIRDQLTTRYAPTTNLRPTRHTVFSPSLCVPSELYHPSEITQVARLIDTYVENLETQVPPPRQGAMFAMYHWREESFFRPSGDTHVYQRGRQLQHHRDMEEQPVSVQVFFGPNGSSDKCYDVTKRVKELVRAEGGLRLLLRPPPPVKDSRGRPRRGPSTFKWWYTRIFGDPCPHVAKYLTIQISNCLTNRVEMVLVLTENSSIDLVFHTRPQFVE